jgi:membrane protein YdbS with pleckstrin-like domain
MMQLGKHKSERVSDTPLGVWFAGVLTIAVGLVVASTQLGMGAGDEDVGSLDWWWIVVSGCIGIVAGVLTLWKCPRTSICGEMGSGRVVIETRGILTRRTKSIDVASVANVLVVYQVDDDGDEEYQA